MIDYEKYPSGHLSDIEVIYKIQKILFYIN